MIAQYVPYAMAAVLLVAMVIELRTGKIPNWLTLVPFLLFIALAATGVDLLSVGALTHSAPTLDVSLELHESTR
mgnify:CR=1 FL=1